MPTIVICGTPGTGKTYLVNQLKEKAELSQFTFINVSQFARENACLSSYDEVLDTHEIDEEKLEEKLKTALSESNNNVVEAIHADMIPQEAVDWVFVCRANNTVLYDRLKARGYNEEKVANNVQAEIFQTILDEALEFFITTVTELPNDNESDGKRNLDTIMNKLTQAVDIRCSSLNGQNA